MATPIGPDELDDATWEVIQKYLSAQMQILKKTSPEDAFQVLKLNWKVVIDTPRMQDFLDQFELVNLKQSRDNQDTERPKLDARITELEETTTESPR